MKIIKERGYCFTEEEYNKITKDNDGRYFLPFDYNKIEGELEKKISISVKDGVTRTQICDQYNISENDLNKWFKKCFGTHRITKVRSKMMESADN